MVADALRLNHAVFGVLCLWSRTATKSLQKHPSQMILTSATQKLPEQASNVMLRPECQWTTPVSSNA
ncbi:hypothetical protein VFPPC_16746 [Pochonia chlamydosporia 170]|uniref:Uncharacterized protein n=1 Tax=Pochonia chlamydosporia 170 TaxID=1380566 RepID=A0A179F591_METCM|nr:hypothetical protein VFPPC_16746 [Pochonia chlamydosporia 170]OAQ60596.1 hypothetical protein VFPPC_16746 [Pochonia chlamydosporia 170]